MLFYFSENSIYRLSSEISAKLQSGAGFPILFQLANSAELDIVLVEEPTDWFFKNILSHPQSLCVNVGEIPCRFKNFLLSSTDCRRSFELVKTSTDGRLAFESMKSNSDLRNLKGSENFQVSLGEFKKQLDDKLIARRKNSIGWPAALFLDRDDVIVFDVPYNGNPDLVKLVPDVDRLILKYQKMDFQAVMVSNQSGIGRGKITVDQYYSVQARVVKELGKLGVVLDQSLFCPYWEDSVIPHEVLPESNHLIFRKPFPGMIYSAMAVRKLNLEKSIFIGDKATDMICAFKAGIGELFLKDAGDVAKEIAMLKSISQDGIEIKYSVVKDYQELL